MTRLASIVEGHGEVSALPELVRRVARSLGHDHALEVAKPIRIARSRLVREGELERALNLAARQTSSGDAILILIDADDDCPAELAPSLLRRARAARPDRRAGVVLANREFESWFLASATSIAGKRGLREDITPPRDSEAIRDAKGWLRARASGTATYRETIDQVALVSALDLTLARSAPSFDKLCRTLDQLLRPDPNG